MDPTETQPKSFGPLDRLCMRIAGIDEETMKSCPHHDLECVRAIAGIMVCVWFYQTALFSLVGHQLFGTTGLIWTDLVIVVGSAFLATFILLIDSYMVMRSGWHLSGISELKRGGIDISGGLGPRIKAGIFLAIRILLSAAIAQLTAIYVSILVFFVDVNSRITSSHIHDNAELIASATSHVDAEIHQGENALQAEAARAATLANQVSALREGKIDPSANQPEIKQAQQEVAQLVSERMKADEALRRAESYASDELAGIRGSANNSGVPGEGPVRRGAMEALTNARNDAKQIAALLDAARGRLDTLRKQALPATQVGSQQSRDILPSFESDLAAEDAKVQALHDDLARLTQHRDEAIRDEVEAAPNHIPANDGLLGRLSMLEQVAQADTKIAAVIVLIDAVSFGFELAAVLAKITSFVPTTYATLLAYSAYMQVVRLVDKMAAELNDRGDEDTPEAEFIPPAAVQPDEAPSMMGVMPDDADPFVSVDPPPSPPKRPRGRPKKTQGLSPMQNLITLPTNWKGAPK